MKNQTRRPLVTKENKLGNMGMRIVQDITEDSLNWIFRPQDTHDFGIDAHIEVVKKGQATGKIIAVQIKCGDSFFKDTDKLGYVFRPKEKHINYWLDFSLPVIIIICNPQTKECWWTEANNNTIRSTGIGWKISIPYAQIFNNTYLHILNQIASRTISDRIRQRFQHRLNKAPIIDDREIIEVIYRGGVIMGFRQVNSNEYSLLAFSQDYILYQSNSFYNINEWVNILNNCGLEDWEISESLDKIYSDIT